jgi:hypothetical protein
MSERVRPVSEPNSGVLHKDMPTVLWLEQFFARGSSGPDEWEDVGSGSGGGPSMATSALTGNQFDISIDNTPLILDTPDGGSGSMNFYTASPTVFDFNAGRARILGPGLYVIGYQLNAQTGPSGVSANTFVYSHLDYQYGGASLEVPWFESGFLAATTLGEEIIGTRYVYVKGDGTSGSWDVGLQRLHPVSLSTGTFPNEIRPGAVTNAVAGELHVNWMALWGVRLGDPLDAYHSD